MSKLKIKEHHYTYILVRMKAKVQELGPQRLVEYTAMLRDDMLVTDVQKRLRWDLFRASIANTDLASLYRDLYEYMNDTHIDTALRHIMAELGTNTL